MVKYIPNTLTALNMVFGFFSIIASLSGNLVLAGYFVLIAGLFDFSDGFAARWLHAYSDLGKQLDSLSDMISFGLAPALILFRLIENSFPISFSFSNIDYYSLSQWVVLISPVFIVLGAGFRLAKFNIDTKQTSSFLGLPTPAAGFFFASLPFLADQMGGRFVDYVLQSEFFLASLSLVFALLMVSRIPMFSLKVNNISEKKAILPVTFILVSGVMLLWFSFKVISPLIILYIFISLIKTLFTKLDVKN